MATRSGIAISHNGLIKAIYCHWDGYLENNGRILNQYYQDTDKINKLVALGDLSSLGAEIGEKNTVSTYKGQCEFFGRDRGEDGTEFKTFETRDQFVSGIDGAYFYLYEDDSWLVSTGAVWKSLKDQLEIIDAEAAQ